MADREDPLTSASVPHSEARAARRRARIQAVTASSSSGETTCRLRAGIAPRPTGWMASENAQIRHGDTVAVWGCGPVGQFAIQSAWLQGASRVFAIDEVPERLAMAASLGRAETLHSVDPEEVYTWLMEATGGRGPDACIDAVGMESHGSGVAADLKDAAKSLTRLDKGANHPYILQQMIRCVRKGGTLSFPGVYVGYLNAIPFGASMNKGLTWKMGQTHMHRYMGPLLQRVLDGEIDPAAIITHRLALDEAPRGYALFAAKDEGCVKVVLSP